MIGKNVSNSPCALAQAEQYAASQLESGQVGNTRGEKESKYFFCTNPLCRQILTVESQASVGETRVNSAEIGGKERCNR